MVSDLSRSLAAHGLALRGGFNFATEDEAPAGLCGRPARAVLLVGNVGAAHWPHFKRWLQARTPAPADPLDNWCRETIGAIARRFEARAVTPSDRPFLPFQRWAMRAEGLRRSPLGILMHPTYGLWHAYRGALLFDAPLALPETEKPIHLCDACVGKPCLNACPVSAYSHAGFAHEACLAHVRGASGAACRDEGCRDRNACPYGAAYRYPPEVQSFHMVAFARL